MPVTIKEEIEEMPVTIKEEIEEIEDTDFQDFGAVKIFKLEYRESDDRPSSENDHDQCDEKFRKLFVGGLTYDTTQQCLHDHFKKWGEIDQCFLVLDPNTRE